MVDIDKEGDGFAAAHVLQFMVHVSGIMSRIASVQFARLTLRGQADDAFLYGEKLARAHEMRCAVEGCAGFQRHFIEFDILFQVERRQSANTALFVIAKEVLSIGCPDDVNPMFRVGNVDQFTEADAEGLRDTEGNSQCRVGGSAFYLTQHRAANAAGRCQLFKGPLSALSQLADAFADLPMNGVVNFRAGWLFLGGHVYSSCRT